MKARMGDVVPVRAGIAAGLLFVLAAVLVQVHSGVTTGTLLYVAGAGLAAITLPLGYACLVAGSAWGFLTGFVVNTGGQLSFDRGDLERLAVLIALSAAVSVLRPRRTRRPAHHGDHGSRV